MPDEPVLVLLVHGTHGGASRWHQDRAREGALPASFRHTIARRLGGLAAIESFGWSGRNAVADRRAAALRLAWRCRQALRAEGHARLVLIGHSHGGNVLDMAAALLPPGLRARVHLVQVSTPFVVETPRYFRLLAADAGRTRVLGMRGDTMLQVMLVASFGFVGGVLPLL